MQMGVLFDETEQLYQKCGLRYIIDHEEMLQNTPLREVWMYFKSCLCKWVLLTAGDTSWHTQAV